MSMHSLATDRAQRLKSVCTASLAQVSCVFVSMKATLAAGREEVTGSGTGQFLKAGKRFLKIRKSTE